MGTFSRRQKYATTFAIYYGNLCLAIGMNAYAPAIVDFRNKYGQKDMDRVAVIFTVLTISQMVGALLTSFIYNFMNRQLGVILSLSGIGAALYLTPLCPTLTILFAVATLLGLCNGMYIASQTVWVIELWQGEAGPFIQGAFFSYTIGALIPSLLLAPFLTRKNEEDEGQGTTQAPDTNDRMWIPFTIAGIIVTIAPIIQLYLFVFQRYVPYAPVETAQVDTEKTNNISNEHTDELKPRKKTSLKYFNVYIILLAAVFMGFSTGLEMVTFQFISTFAQFGELNMSENEGAQVITAVTASYAVGRGLGILTTLKIPPQFILGFDLVLAFVASTILLVFGNSVAGLWAGVALLGLGLSTVSPCFCAYIEKYITFTNAIGSLMIVSGSVVAAIYPLVIGPQIEENPQVLNYANLFSASILTVAIIALLKLTYGRMK